MNAIGGENIFGFSIGILMLESKFPRIPGDMGNATTSKAILGDDLTLDVEKSKAELVKTATNLVSDHPDVGAIVLECTNMTPYAAAIQKEIDLPVFDIYTLVQMVHQVLVRHEFCGYL